jgi:hypothetical protein
MSYDHDDYDPRQDDPVGGEGILGLFVIGAFFYLLFFGA